MCKGKLAVLGLVAVSLLAWSGLAVAGTIDPCLSSATLNATIGPPCPLFACPQGDTGSFISQGWSISVIVLDGLGDPVVDVPASDGYLVDCDPVLSAVLCGGSASSALDANTDVNGAALMSLGSMAASGCADGVNVVVQGFILNDPASCVGGSPCKPINIRSPDLTGDGTINLSDLSLFAAAYPPNAFDKCADFNLSGPAINLSDLSALAFHFGPPGHNCGG